LVQFAQWRPLDSIKALKKLSLCSNRIKGIRDDRYTNADGRYFPALEELDLSQNEIDNTESVEILRSFKALRTIRVDENPLRAEHIGNIELLRVVQPDPWYLKGRKWQAGIASRKWAKIEYIESQMQKVRGVYDSFFLTDQKINVDEFDELRDPLLGLTDEELDVHFRERRQDTNVTIFPTLTSRAMYLYNGLTRAMYKL